MRNNSTDINGVPAKGSKAGMEKININPAKILKVLLSRWYWVLIAFIVCVCIGLLYARSSKEQFVSESILQYDSKSKEAKFSTNTLLSGGSSESTDYMAEVYRIKSTDVLYEALDSLNTTFFFYEKRGLRRVNLYPHRPFESNILDYDIEKYPGGTFSLTKNNNQYNIRFENEGADIDIVFKNVKAGSVIKIPGFSFLLKSNVLTEFRKITFTYVDYWTVKSMSDRIVIKEAERNLPVLRATFNSDNSKFTRDFLNTVIASYSNFDLDGKRLSSEQSLKFINEQLTAFEGLMKLSSSKMESIKNRYELLDVSATSNQFMSSINNLRERKLQLKIQEDNFKLVTEDIKNNKEVVANVIGWDGMPDPFLNQMLQELNTAYRSRKQNLINYSDQSIVIKNLDDEIAQLKRKIIENINLQTRKSEQAYNAYDAQLKDINKDLSKMPSAEKDLIYTTSDVDVNKNIYTLLLNKKLETNIDKAGQTPSFKSIEKPVVAIRTAPNEFLIVLIAGLIGIVVGVAGVFLKRLFNTRFTDVSIIEKQQNVSLLGVVGHNAAIRNIPEHEILNLQTEDELFSEGMNSVRTNILYQFDNKVNKIISVTSGMAGEGKSFIAISLGVALAKLSKTVIIVESDLRRPKLHKYFGKENMEGLSNYLDQEIAIDKVINRSGYDGLDFITSGQLSRNPSELLHTDKFLKMMQSLKEKYDYVIIDTAPVGIVTDGIPALRISDASIFILRWRYSPNDLVMTPYALANNYSLKKVGIIVNDFRDDALYASLDVKDGEYNNLYSNNLYYQNKKKTGRRNIFGTKS